MAGPEGGHLETQETVLSKEEISKLAVDIATEIDPPVIYLVDKLNNYMFDHWGSKGPQDRLGQDFFFTPTDKFGSKDPCLSGEQNEACFASSKTPEVILDAYHKIHRPIWHLPQLVVDYLQKPLLNGEWERWPDGGKISYKKDLSTVKKVLAENLKGDYKSYEEVFNDLEKIYPILVETLGMEVVEDIEKQYGIKINPENIKMARHMAEMFLSDK